jgi:tripartite ATP-independent transporter DctM subunit
LDPTIAGLIAFIAVIALIVLGVHIGIAMMAIGFGGMLIMQGFQPVLNMVLLTFFHTVYSYDLAILPLFILMGEFAMIAGIVRSLYDAARTWFRRVPGGLAITTIATCAGLAACTGSSLASAVTVTRIALPEMIKSKYSPNAAAATIAAGGILAVLIPPSALIILYALLTNTSIAKALIAGVIPGFLTVIIYLSYILISAYVNPRIMPLSGEQSAPWKEKFIRLNRCRLFLYGAFRILKLRAVLLNN